MNLTLKLSPETEAKLKEHATRTGKRIEELAMEALQEGLASEPTPTATLPLEDWLQRFDAWVKEQPSRNPHFDDSRESIYVDRS